MSALDSIILSTTTERKQMTINDKLYAVGDLFTTQKSGVTGTIKEIVPNVSGSTRVLLETTQGDRWTTVLATK
jgi:hypothetical protein